VRTAHLVATQQHQRETGGHVGDLPASYLVATRAGGANSHWKVRRDEVERFGAERQAPAVTVGFDVTFSVPKSVSILWATVSPQRRALIVSAVHRCVAAGVSYLEDNAAFVHRGSARQAASGVVAACYTHATSRARKSDE